MVWSGRENKRKSKEKRREKGYLYLQTDTARKKQKPIILGIKTKKKQNGRPSGRRATAFLLLFRNRSSQKGNDRAKTLSILTDTPCSAVPIPEKEIGSLRQPRKNIFYGPSLLLSLFSLSFFLSCSLDPFPFRCHSAAARKKGIFVLFCFFFFLLLPVFGHLIHYSLNSLFLTIALLFGILFPVFCTQISFYFFYFLKLYLFGKRDAHIAPWCGR